MIFLLLAAADAVERLQRLSHRSAAGSARRSQFVLGVVVGGLPPAHRITLQAFIFMVLTIVYLAMAHEHH